MKQLIGILALALTINAVQALTLDRRTCLEYLTSLAIVPGTMEPPTTELATSDSVVTLPTMPENFEITDKVYIDVRVARSDGSTYVRDDLPDTFENRVLQHCCYSAEDCQGT